MTYLFGTQWFDSMQHSLCFSACPDSTLLFFFHHLSHFCLLLLFVTDHENHTHTSSQANSVASSSSYGRAHAQYSEWGTYFSLCCCHFCCGWNSSGWGWQSLMNPQKLPNFFFYHLWVIFLWQVLVFAVPSTSLSKRSKNTGPKPFCRTSGVALTHINS